MLSSHGVYPPIYATPGPACFAAQMGDRNAGLPFKIPTICFSEKQLGFMLGPCRRPERFKLDRLRSKGPFLSIHNQSTIEIVKRLAVVSSSEGTGCHEGSCNHLYLHIFIPDDSAFTGLPDYKVTPWQSSRSIPIQELKLTLDSMPRKLILEMAWFELLSPRSDSVALALLTYLSRTEDSKYVRGYFHWLLQAAFPRDPDDELARWPERFAPRHLGLELRDLCALYDHARK